MESSTIFSRMATLVQDDVFLNAQHTFFDKHKNSFEDTEENKLEYTQIFEQYVTILEEIITARLNDTFSPEEINGFYGSFKDNLAKYEAENPIAVEIIFGLIDFDKFKAAILTYKADNATNDSNLAKENTIECGNMDE